MFIGAIINELWEWKADSWDDIKATWKGMGNAYLHPFTSRLWIKLRNEENVGSQSL
jgi:hypothetical protein